MLLHSANVYPGMVSILSIHRLIVMGLMADTEDGILFMYINSKYVILQLLFC